MTKSIKSVYFAHPFDTWKTPREGMITKYLTERGYNVYNPFVEEDKLNEKYGTDNYYQKPSIEFAKDIVDKDHIAVKKTDEYFGWFPKNITMIGTPIELVWAFRMGKKTTVLCYKPQPFLWYYSDVFFTDYKSFVENKPFWTREKWDAQQEQKSGQIQT